MSRLIRCLALDPGERVGWATGNIEIPDEGQPGLVVVKHGIHSLKDCALATHRAVVEEDRIDVLIYETWLLAAGKAKAFIGNDFQPSQFIGMVRLCAWLNPRVQLRSQGPKAMYDADKSLLNTQIPGALDVTERLSKLPKSHDESHDGSALRHLWTYFFERHA